MVNSPNTRNQPLAKRSIDEEPREPGLVAQPRDVLSSSIFETRADENDGLVITSIRAIGITATIERLHASFYAVVQHSGREWRTESKPISVDDDVEWDGPIPIPSDLTTAVCLRIRASFEFQPLLGSGEQLRELCITVNQLLEHGAINHPFTFRTEGDDGISSCSSILVFVKRIQHGSSDSPESRVPNDLEQAISSYKRAVNLMPDGHPGKPCRLNALGNLFLARFERFGNHNDLEQAILRHKDAVNTTPDCHPHKLGHLFDLRNSFRARFDRVGDPSDLERMISTAKEFVDVIPNGDPHKPSHLNELGYFFLIRFMRLGERGDLEKAILCYRDAASLALDCDPNIHGLTNLGFSLKTRFNLLGEMSDLEEAILVYRKAINVTPDGHQEKSCRLNTLGNLFGARFERLGDHSNLEQAVSIQKNAVYITPDCHPHRLGHLHDLRDIFQACFDQFGDPGDLDQVISVNRELINITLDDHPRKPSFLNALGNSLLTRFESLGKLGDLEQAISRHRNAVNLISDSHHDKPGYLSNLGVSSLHRFDHVGELSNLEQTISWQRRAVDLTPNGDSHKPDRLTNLGNSLLTRFKRHKIISDLEETISGHRHAVDLSPVDHPNKPRYLNNLGNSLVTRFTHLGDLGALEEAISRYRDATVLAVDGRSTQPEPQHLCNLGSALFFRFGRLGELADLERAILMQRTAVELTPEHHPLKPPHLERLADSFTARFRRLGEVNDFQQATSLYSQAATASVGLTTIRFRASRKWIDCAHVLRHHSLLHAYSVAIDLLPQLACIGLSLTRRYEELISATGVVREAAAVALDSGHAETAVEWLQQGRSIVWGELFQLRTLYEELSFVHPGHARRLQELSSALERASTTREISFPSQPGGTRGKEHPVTQSLEEEADRHRALAIERDGLLQKIRGLPGFERFLLRKEYSLLRASAHSGPVVVLNAAKDHCDALIVLADEVNVVHVPLPNFTLKQSSGLQSILDNLLGPSRGIPCDDRAGRPSSQKNITWESLLSSLWKCVVKPVLDVLGLSTPGNLSRIFWCPTGPFTIHAAGLYGTQYAEPSHRVSDFVISSYVPTLSILTPPGRGTASNGEFCMLAVPQPSSDGQSRLPGVQTELEHVKAAIKNSETQIALQESSTGTVEEVLGLMKDANWVHFACHGIQDSETPSNSGLCLADGCRLKLSDMISLSRPHGGLAFLSACQTATGDKMLSDEAIHIAAGMLSAGYGGVIATMWSISDRVAPCVAKDVYEELFSLRTGAIPNYREAARALHNAVVRLRNDGASFVEWVPFIHVGL